MLIQRTLHHSISFTSPLTVWFLARLHFVRLSSRPHRAYALPTEVRESLKQKYNISENEYRLIETVIIENQPHKAGPQWKFAGALYFVTVVVAMIGE